MSKNELDEDVPVEVEAKALELKCAKGVTYVYRNGVYPKKGPKASIGCQRTKRFPSGDYDAYKQDLGHGWVAFKSPSSVAANLKATPLPDGELPPLPMSR